jgi:hypothetical protein
VWNEFERIKLKEIVSGMVSDGNFEGNGHSVELGSPETENPALQHAAKSMLVEGVFGAP